MSDINMNWESVDFTVYALNEQDVNDFSFHVQGNGRNGHDPQTLKKVVAMAKAAPDMYQALLALTTKIKNNISSDIGDEELALYIAQAEASLAKARNEQ